MKIDLTNLKVEVNNQVGYVAQQFEAFRMFVDECVSKHNNGIHGDVSDDLTDQKAQFQNKEEIVSIFNLNRKVKEAFHLGKHKETRAVKVTTPAPKVKGENYQKTVVTFID